MTPDSPTARYSATLELDLGTVVPSLAGPKRPQDRIALTDSKAAFQRELDEFQAIARRHRQRGRVG